MHSVHIRPNLIIRHRKERLEKCSLYGLESRQDLIFFRYPDHHQPTSWFMDNAVLLTLDAPALSPADHDHPLLLVDGTWRLAEKILGGLHRSSASFTPRSIPAGWKTAYPRKQPDCPDEEAGLASVEALYIAYLMTGRDPEGLMDHYLWKDRFLEINAEKITGIQDSIRDPA